MKARYNPDFNMRNLFIVIFFALSACTPKQLRPQVTPTSTKPVCTPSPTQPSNSGFPEVKGTMKSEGEMWGLLFFDKALANQDEKFVWRITGNGPGFNVQAQHEDGTVIQPIWGPDFHDSSSWNRPGTEWGTGFNFPKPGCWTITVSSGSTVGTISLEVYAQ